MLTQRKYQRTTNAETKQLPAVRLDKLMLQQQYWNVARISPTQPNKYDKESQLKSPLIPADLSFGVKNLPKDIKVKSNDSMLS